MKWKGIVKVASGVSSAAALDSVACCSLFVLKVQHHGQLLVSNSSENGGNFRQNREKHSTDKSFWFLSALLAVLF